MDDTPTRHKLNLTVDGHETYRWLRSNGYDMVDAGPSFSGGEPGILFARPNQPARIALNHRVLVWDGREVSVLQDRHALTPGTDINDTLAWLEKTGYEAWPVIDGRDFFFFQRERWPTITARLGDTLVWDGHTLTVEET